MSRFKKEKIILLLFMGALHSPAQTQTINLEPQPVGWAAGDITAYLNLTGYPVLDYSSGATQVTIGLDQINTDVIVLVHHDLNWCDGVELHAILTRAGSGKNAFNEPDGTNIQITTIPVQFLSAGGKVNNARIQYRLYSWDQMPEVGDHSTTVTYTVQSAP